MADEVYRKVGRGGAGNFYSKTDVESIAHTQTASCPWICTFECRLSNNYIQIDLEAQAVQLTSTTGQSSAPEYLHTGRGGAGNWAQPSAEAAAEASSAPKIPVATPVAKQVYRGGRGGAGNFHDVEAEEKVQKEEEERVARVTEERIVKDVERGLARPEKTYQGKGGSWEMN